eukprot:Awhi_evm2s12626
MSATAIRNGVQFARKFPEIIPVTAFTSIVLTGMTFCALRSATQCQLSKEDPWLSVPEGQCTKFLDTSHINVAREAPNHDVLKTV